MDPVLKPQVAQSAYTAMNTIFMNKTNNDYNLLIFLFDFRPPSSDGA